MNTVNFESLDEAIEFYGRENLIAIDNLKQIIFYTRNGYQPKFVWEKEGSQGRITAWFHKSETKAIYKKWMENRPIKE